MKKIFIILVLAVPSGFLYCPYTKNVATEQLAENPVQRALAALEEYKSVRDVIELTLEDLPSNPARRNNFIDIALAKVRTGRELLDTIENNFLKASAAEKSEIAAQVLYGRTLFVWVDMQRGVLRDYEQKLKKSFY